MQSIFLINPLRRDIYECVTYNEYLMRSNYPTSEARLDFQEEKISALLPCNMHRVHGLATGVPEQRIGRSR